MRVMHLDFGMQNTSYRQYTWLHKYHLPESHVHHPKMALWSDSNHFLSSPSSSVRSVEQKPQTGHFWIPISAILLDDNTVLWIDSTYCLSTSEPHNPQWTILRAVILIFFHVFFSAFKPSIGYGVIFLSTALILSITGFMHHPSCVFTHLQCAIICPLSL